MPELKRFDGIVIYLMFNDIKHHNKPHVHVFYGEFRASVAITALFWLANFLQSS